jgi:hypothetical protein
MLSSNRIFAAPYRCIVSAPGTIWDISTPMAQRTSLGSQLYLTGLVAQRAHLDSPLIEV